MRSEGRKPQLTINHRAEIMFAELGIEGIYVTHTLSGYEMQEKWVMSLFARNGLEFEFVTDGDPSLFTDDLIAKYFVPDIREKLPTGILSVTLSHILCYERIAAARNKYALVFENDPFFLGDFRKKIGLVAREADSLEPGFLISLENTTLTFPSRKVTRKGKYLYEADKGRCAGAYMLDLRAATDILEDLKTSKCPIMIDWWHNLLIERGVVRMYWAHPPLVEQGSHNGKMNATISKRGRGIRRQIAWKAHKFYKTHILRRLR
jgi:glycosyl transferase family 25